ncbi:MAG: hypothetical protein ABWY63_01695 [Hyphomicrobiaceae bacterium]
MATRAALVREILKELGVHQAGQDLPPEDYRAVDESLNFRILAMAKARVYSLDTPDIVPDEALSELARYFAGEYAQVFGLAGEELATVVQNAGLAEQALRFQRTRVPTYSIQRSERC